MSVADVNSMNTMLYPALDVFASELIASLPANKAAILEVLNTTESFAYFDYKDLYDFAWEISNRVPVAAVQEAAEELMNATDASIVANFAGWWHPDAHGLSIFLPSYSSSSIVDYDVLDMSVDLMWNDFIVALLMTVADGYEIDDTYLEANTILPGETQWHSIHNWGTDVDWVTFTISNLTQVRITTSGPEGMGDSVLRLYNSSSVPNWPIAENDDYNNLWSRIDAWLGPGVYWVQVSAYNYEADIPTYSLTLTLGPFPNEPPVASWYWYGSPYVGSYVSFDGSGSYDPDGYIVNYSWNFGDNSSTYGNWVSHMYSWAGDFMVTLTVTDDQGLTSSYSRWITITQGNMPPVAVGTITPQNPAVGELVTFDGSMSYDPDGYVTSWYWYFGDGYYSSGSVAHHSYSIPGTYTVELSIYDNYGSWSHTYLYVTVHQPTTPVPPVAVIAYAPSQPFVWEPVLFSGNFSIDPDGYLTSFIWQFGDGTVGFGSGIAHAYAHPGTYMVSLSVIDNSGLSDETTTTIRVVSMPIAAFVYAPLMPLAGQSTDFSALGSYDESGITEYIWSFGDGTFASGWQSTHAFASPGNYSVILTVRNADGIEASHSEVVTVASAQLSVVADSSDHGDIEKLEGSPTMMLAWITLLGICATGSGLVVRSRRP
jgi:PKD repeat protein